MNPVCRKVVGSKERDFGDGARPYWRPAVILECGHALPMPSMLIASEAARDALEIPCGMCSAKQQDETRRADELAESMTCGQLIEALQAFAPDTTVLALWDTIPNFTVHRLEPLNGCAIIDCGDGDGDWLTVASDVREGRSAGELTAEQNAELDAYESEVAADKAANQ